MDPSTRDSVEEQDSRQISNNSERSYIFFEISIAYTSQARDTTYIFLAIITGDEDTISIEPMKRLSGSQWKSNKVVGWPVSFDRLLLRLYAEVDNSRVESIGSIYLIRDELQPALLSSSTKDTLYTVSSSDDSPTVQLMISEVELPPDVLEAIDDPTAESQEILLLEMDDETDENTQIPSEALSNSATLFLCLFETTNKRADNAVLLHEVAVSSLEPISPSYSTCVHKAGIAYLERFGLIGDLEDLNIAILRFREASSSVAEDKEIELPPILGDIANAYFYRFERLAKPEDINDAIAAQKRALELTPKDHQHYMRRLNNLGVLLQQRFQNGGNMKDLEEAIELQEKAIEGTPADEPQLLAWRLNNLVASLQSHFEGTGNLKDLKDAIPLQQRAIDLVDDGNANKAVYYSNLGNVIRRKFDFEGNIDGITWAIEMQQTAVDLSNPHDASHSSYLNNLSNCLICRYERLGSSDDLARGVALQRKAVSLRNQKQAEYARHNNNLGTSLIRWYEHTGIVTDIDEAVASLRKPLELIDENSPEYATYLSNLGTALQCRFEHTLHLEDIEEAISVLQKALSLVSESTANYVNHLESLGRAYQDRFERTGNIRDLDEAITLQQRAVELTPESSPSLPSYLSNLGNTIWCRTLRVEGTEDIDRAIELQKRAVTLTPQGHPDLPNHLHNLGNALRHRCDHGGTLEDVDYAISVQKRAIALTSDDSPELSRRLETLGYMLRCRVDHTDADEDIDEAISTFRKVIQLTPEQHLSRWSKFHSIAGLLGRRFHGNEKREDVEEAISCYRSAAMSVAGLPLNRIKSARQWAKTYLAYIGEESGPLLEAYDLAFQLLPQTVWLGYTIRGRYEQLKDIADLSNEAAAVAISTGELEKGLQWLEQGRCIIWSQLSSLRHPVDALRDEEPGLADNLLRVSLQLQAAGSHVEDQEVSSNMMQKISVQAQVREHQKLAEEWQMLLKQTRTITGFEDFLQPFSLSNQRLSELLGLVVVINVHLMGCDALVLSKKEPQISHIPLPDFSVDKSQSLLKILNETFINNNVRMRDSRGGRLARPGAAPKGMKLILEELWICLVHPILMQLGFMTLEGSNSTEKMPRIWWCPTGTLTFLPIHAAGLYDIPGKPSCSKYVVSSYIPNVSALFEKLGQGRSSRTTELLAIGQRKADAFPLLSELPNVVDEMEVIQRIFDESQMSVKIMADEEVTVSSVLNIMADYPWIHLACHASQEQNPPTNSGFYFNDGQLTLSELIQKSLPQGEFAFLSACQTSTGDRYLSEEAVHLAAGMLAAGYRGVVATMWSISDEYAPVVAREVYSYLLAKNNKANDNSGDKVFVAEALHHAIMHVRGQYNDDELSLLSWVPYIHMGL